MKVDKNNRVVMGLTQVWIEDLVGLGMSYSRISMRLGLSPSTIQKIVRQNRLPRMKTLMSLGQYYIKIFSAPHNHGANTQVYYRQHEARIQCALNQTQHLLMMHKIDY